jgi:50S ribosomal protein L16 3-hydroxylase
MAKSRRTGDTADKSRRTGDTADKSRRTGDTADKSRRTGDTADKSRRTGENINKPNSNHQDQCTIGSYWPDKIHLGCEPEVFLHRFWQKKPKLVRAALGDFNCPITANDLAALAMESHASSRLVSGKNTQFRVENGPFTEKRLTQLGKKDCTLLVQGVDQFDPDVRALLQLFSFLPNWRIEDVMVSYAVAGGSVGAHVDQYDVFLLQVRGQRRWQIDDRKRAQAPNAQKFVESAPLKLLQHFEPNQDWVLSPGDMLYLPPGVPHHGTALDNDCMTFSIGLRAPSIAEMLRDLLDTELFSDQLRYRDPDLMLDEAGAGMHARSLQRVRRSLNTILALDDADLGQWFAAFSSRYRAPRLPELVCASNPKRHQTLLSKLEKGQGLELHPALRAVRFGKSIAIGGKTFSFDAKLMDCLAARSGLISQTLFASLSIDAQNWVETLLHARVLAWRVPA